jgi:two-component system chemotaxis sensor kinase CheA
MTDKLHSDQDGKPPAKSALPLTGNDLLQDRELVAEFVAESSEHISSIETYALVLEQDPANSNALQSVFRSFHSVKGLAGFLGLSTLQQVSHEVENLLDLARSNRLVVDPSVVDVVLEGADFIKRSVGRVEAILKGATPPLEDPGDNLVRKVHALITPPTGLPEENAAKNDKIARVSAGEVTIEAGVLRVPDLDSQSESVVRVHISKLDYLVDMVGELVIAQSLLQVDSEIANTRLTRKLTQLRRTTGEIQKTAMSMRMIPVGHLFRRMARIVRDLARRTGKTVELETTGEETELDRNIIEELVDPLMHMIRNSIDHGIESPEERAAAGKSAIARVALKASHQAGHIVIEVADDGGGIDQRRVLERALASGIVASGAELTEGEVYELIFQPGFSTAKSVTDVSGRGVGLDVVRKHVERLRGRIHIESTRGSGTTFYLKLPLTLAIIDGLVVGVGAERYVVPIFSVREVLRPTPVMMSSVQNRGEMVLVRGRLLPVIRLYRRFHLAPASENATDGILIISDSGSKPFGLLVDRLMGKQEVVIKGMGEKLKDIPGIAGSAILGDGHVGLILDMEGLCHDIAA